MFYSGKTPSGFEVHLSGDRIGQNEDDDIWVFSVIGFFNRPSCAMFRIRVKTNSRKKTVLRTALNFIDEHYGNDEDFKEAK